MDTKTFIEKFENALDDIDPGSITPETLLLSLPQWDSLAILNVLVMSDIEYNVQISGTEVQKAQTVNDLYLVVADKVSKLK